MPNTYKNKVVYNGTTLIDLTADTAIASDVLSGKYFHLATGERVAGTASGGLDLPTFTITNGVATCNKTYADCRAMGVYKTAYAIGKDQDDSVMFEYVGESYSLSADAIHYVFYIQGVPRIGLDYNSDGTIDLLNEAPSVVSATFTENGTYESESTEVWNTVTVNVSSAAPTLQAKTATPTTSQQTVTADSGYDGLSSVTVAAMPTGTAGTPTATKGSVSNHSVSVTPSVTNTTGYITGGTKNGTAVTVSASELVSGSETKTENGTYDVTNLASLTVNVAGGGSATYRLDNIVPEQTVACITFMQNNAYYGLPTYSSPIDDAEQYLVTFDGTEYVCEGYVPESNATGVGDIRVVNTNSASYLITPFFIEYQTSLGVGLIVRGSGTHTVKVDKLTFIDDGTTFTTKTITQNGTYNASSDDADGYSSVTVNVSGGGGSSKNVQVAQSTNRATSSTYTSVCSLTCSTAGTYDVYWDCFRSSTGGTSGSQLYIGGDAYGSANTSFTNHAQTNHLTGVSLSKNQTVAVYARSRGSNYYAYCGQLTIVQTA